MKTSEKLTDSTLQLIRNTSLLYSLEKQGRQFLPSRATPIPRWLPGVTVSISSCMLRITSAYFPVYTAFCVHWI